MSYRQTPQPTRRVFMGEDFVFSTVIRDEDGDPADLTGATATLTLFAYGMEGYLLTANLSLSGTPTDGVLSGTVASSAVSEALTPGLYRYQVKVTKDSVVRVAEAGLIDLVGGAT